MGFEDVPRSERLAIADVDPRFRSAPAILHMPDAAGPQTPSDSGAERAWPVMLAVIAAPLDARPALE
jgi:hypothetical protein